MGLLDLFGRQGVQYTPACAKPIAKPRKAIFAHARGVPGQVIIEAGLITHLIANA